MKGDTVAPENLSKEHIKEYLASTAQSLRQSLDLARDSNTVLASLVATALTRGIKIDSPSHSKRASLVYYDRFIKPENCPKRSKQPTPRRRLTRRKPRERYLERTEIQTLETSQAQPDDSKLPVLDLSYLPVIFPREDRRRAPSFVRHIVGAIRKKKELKREKSESSLASSPTTTTHASQRGGLSPLVRRSIIGPPVNSENEELKAHFKEICLAGGDGTFQVTRKGFKTFLQRRYTERMAEIIAKALHFPERAHYKDFCYALDKFMASSRSRALRVAFMIYDDDEDKMLTERDLYMPFIAFSDELYDDVYLTDLPRILAQLNVKISLNRDLNKARTVRERETLTFKEFSRIFEMSYPEIFADVLFYITKYRIEDKESAFNLLKEEGEEEDEKVEPWKDREIRSKVSEILGKYSKAGKVIDVFQQLSANPRRGEHLQYLTLGSLTKNFETVFGYTNKYILYRFFRMLFKDNTGAEDQSKISLTAYATSIQNLFDMRTSKLNEWAFRLYDSNEDGLLGIAELCTFQKEVPAGCKLFDETQMAIDEYMNSKVYKTPGTQSHEIDAKIFTSVVGESVLGKEFMRKLSGDKSDGDAVIQGREVLAPAREVAKSKGKLVVSFAQGAAKPRKLRFKDQLNTILEGDMDSEEMIKKKKALSTIFPLIKYRHGDN